MARPASFGLVDALRTLAAAAALAVAWQAASAVEQSCSQCLVVGQSGLTALN